PLRKTREPDLSFIVSAVESIAQHLKDEQLIVLESTTYPGTTEELVLPILEKTGRKVGKDFYLAFSPERIDPGNQQFGLRNTPKVIGGVTPQCLELASLLYGSITNEVVPVSSPKAAEMVKLLENTFRAVNIALVNEICLMAKRLDLNVWEVIAAAGTKPFGFMKFQPGPGLGGHCIPIDPQYLSWKLKTLNYHTRFIQLAEEINSSMPHVVVERVVEALNSQRKSIKGSKILLVGVSYKRDTSDTRESPALEVWSLLENKGALLSYLDPFVPEIMLEERLYKSVEKNTALSSYDCVVILTDHTDLNYRDVADKARLVVDTRNVTSHIKKAEKIFKL
ncbi:MAG TPA: nucleotide sugar dehydrogenase, partial [Bdellovibrionota bacterium]|nr:nucleotide sugar dehydrogenase [Bdellovibrionota bacterium]